MGAEMAQDIMDPDGGQAEACACEPINNGVLMGSAERGDLATRFQPGHGVSRGRPRGSRNKLSETFIGELCGDFEEHGRGVIERVRREDPVAYLAIIAKLVPKDFVMGPDKPRQSLHEYTNEELLAIIEQADQVPKPIINISLGRTTPSATGNNGCERVAACSKMNVTG